MCLLFSVIAGMLAAFFAAIAVFLLISFDSVVFAFSMTLMPVFFERKICWL